MQQLAAPQCYFMHLLQRDSTSIRLSFDRAIIIRRPTTIRRYRNSFIIIIFSTIGSIGPDV